MVMISKDQLAKSLASMIRLRAQVTTLSADTKHLNKKLTSVTESLKSIEQHHGCIDFHLFPKLPLELRCIICKSGVFLFFLPTFYSPARLQNHPLTVLSPGRAIGAFEALCIGTSIRRTPGSHRWVRWGPNLGTHYNIDAAQDPLRMPRVSRRSFES